MGEERVLAELLQLAGNTVAPSTDGLERIRARIAQSRRPWWRRALAYLTRKNGVPGWTPGTPPHCKTDGWKEPKAMSHDLIHEGTPRGRQMAAALALAHLLESGPDETAEWRIDDHGALHGHVRRPASDTAARIAMAGYAEFLVAKVERSQGRNDHAEWIRLCTSGTYRGVPVNVWTHVAIRSLTPFGSKA
ncbi:hypothetical protein ACIBI3_02190 [Actinomadura luteofluorescens]|uniref:hypothetical protein n=1 Tax=Actinomadura luteofluorescens TaxID=46163 RepID=UPI003487E0FF